MCLSDILDNAIKTLEENLFIALDIHAPKRSCILKKSLEPWMTDNLHAFQRDRERLYRKFKYKKSQKNLENYRQVRKIATQNTTQARIYYYNSRKVNSHESKTT